MFRKSNFKCTMMYFSSSKIHSVILKIYLLRTRRSGFEFRQSEQVFSPPKRPAWLWGPPRLLCSKHRKSLLGIKRPGRETNHSSHPSTEAKSEWGNISSPLRAFMAWSGTNVFLILLQYTNCNTTC